LISFRLWYTAGMVAFSKAAESAALSHTWTQRELRSVFSAAAKTCFQKGYPVDDVEYDSAINLAVCMALRDWKPKGGRSLQSLATLYALRNCRDVEAEHKRWRRQDEAGACRGNEVSYMREDLPVRLEDFDFLSFVAHHGRTQAAKLLGIHYYRLRDMLDEVALRLKNR